MLSEFSARLQKGQNKGKGAGDTMLVRLDERIS